MNTTTSSLTAVEHRAEEALAGALAHQLGVERATLADALASLHHRQDTIAAEIGELQAEVDRRTAVADNAAAVADLGVILAPVPPAERRRRTALRHRLGELSAEHEQIVEKVTALTAQEADLAAQEAAAHERRGVHRQAARAAERAALVSAVHAARSGYLLALIQAGQWNQEHQLLKEIHPYHQYSGDRAGLRKAGSRLYRPAPQASVPPIDWDTDRLCEGLSHWASLLLEDPPAWLWMAIEAHTAPEAT